MNSTEHAYSALDPNSQLYFDAYLPISEMENGQDITQWPTRIMIADGTLTKNAEMSSFGDERKVRVDLRKRLDKLKEHRTAEINRRRAIAQRYGLVGTRYS